MKWLCSVQALGQLLCRGGEEARSHAAKATANLVANSEVLIPPFCHELLLVSSSPPPPSPLPLPLPPLPNTLQLIGRPARHIFTFAECPSLLDCLSLFVEQRPTRVCTVSRAGKQTAAYRHAGCASVASGLAARREQLRRQQRRWWRWRRSRSRSRRRRRRSGRCGRAECVGERQR